MATAPAQTGTESSLSSWAGPYVTNMLARGAALGDQPYYAYTGPLTSGAAPLQQQAFQGIAGLAVPTGMEQAATTAGQVATQAGGLSYAPTEFTSGVFDTAAAKQYMNPFLEAAMQPQIQAAQRQAEQQRLADAARLTQAGAYGGSRQAIMDAESRRNQLENIANIRGTGYAQAYDRAQQAFMADQARALQAQQASEASKQFGANYGLGALQQQLAAAQAQSGLSQAGLGAEMGLLRGQAELGGVQRGIESEGITADRLQFEEERDFPYKQVQYMQSLLQGLPIAAQSYNYAKPSALSEFMSTAGGISDLLGNFMPKEEKKS